MRKRAIPTKEVVLIKKGFLILLSFGLFCAGADNLTAFDFPNQELSEEEKALNREKSAIQPEQTGLLFAQKASHQLEELLPLEEAQDETDEDTGSAGVFTNNQIESSWKTAFKTKFFKTAATTNAIVSTEVYGKLIWKFWDTWSFHTQGLVIGRNGFTQSANDRDDRARGLHLVEGYFKWRPFSYFFLEMGNIRQDFLQAPLLITDRTFPSFKGDLSLYSFSTSRLSLLFQFAIPDNASELVKRDPQRLPPLFFTYSALVNAPEFLFDSSIKGIFTFFYYDNLSSAIAGTSEIYGNEVDGQGSDARFRYDYVGLHNHLSLKKNFSNLWIGELGSEYLYNLAAPDTYNEGMRIYISIYHNYRNFMELKGITELFAVQSDSSVAYYSSEVYGRNNRRGFLAGLQSHFYNSGLTLGTSFVYGRPINVFKGRHIGQSFSISFYLMTNSIAI